MSDQRAAEVIDSMERKAEILATYESERYPTEIDALMALLSAATKTDREDFFYAYRNARQAFMSFQEQQRTAAMARDFGGFVLPPVKDAAATERAV